MTPGAVRGVLSVMATPRRRTSAKRPRRAPARRPRRNGERSEARLYADARDDLHGPMAMWVHYGDGPSKRDLLAAYEALPEPARAAWDRAVRAAFRDYHGADTAVMYRRLKGEAAGATSGMSVTTSASNARHGKTMASYVVHASDVLAHHAQSDTPLASKAYGHEAEVILRPGNRAELRDVVQNW